jgi:acyl dehydratase
MAATRVNGIEDLRALVGRTIGPSDWREVTVNYGWNKVRFPAPVPVGSKVRASIEVVSVDDVDGGWFQVVQRWTLGIEGSDKPCCVADSVTRVLS